jgi:hypothetical protein
VKRPVDIKNMTSVEIENFSLIADKLFDTFGIDTKVNLKVKEAFILGFLHGREHTLDEMGIFDDLEDDSKIYDFILNNEDKFKKNNN